MGERYTLDHLLRAGEKLLVASWWYKCAMRVKGRAVCVIVVCPVWRLVCIITTHAHCCFPCGSVSFPFSPLCLAQSAAGAL